MKRTLNRAMTLGLLVLAFAAVAVVPAFAETAVTNAVNTAITDAETSVTGILSTNAPKILAVALLWVIVAFGRKVLANFR